jgi:hypothetical protein
MHKACAIEGVTYTTDHKAKGSGDSDEDDLELLEEIIVLSDFKV